MIIGQLLNSGASGAALSYYTPWFARGGNYATMVANVIQISTDCSVTVTVETKNSEDSDKGIGAVTWPSAAITATGFTDWAAGQDMGNTTDEGLLELVRYKIVVSGAGNQEWVHIRLLNPSWQSN